VIEILLNVALNTIKPKQTKPSCSLKTQFPGFKLFNFRHLKMRKETDKALHMVDMTDILHELLLLTKAEV
jgi:hypothetical protein